MGQAIAPPLSSLDQLKDPAWLTSVLQARDRLARDRQVVEISIVPMPEGVGLASELGRLELVDDAGSFQRLIVKSATLSELRPLADASGVYDRELAFYERFAGTCPLSTPGVIFAARTRDGSDFLLLLEDLSVDFGIRSYDQIEGVDLADAMDLVATLLPFHRWSESVPPSEKADLPTLSGFLEPISGIVPQCWMRYLEITNDDVPDAVTSIAQRFPELFGEMLPNDLSCQTLVHGDLRADNLFRRPDGTFVVIDFQVFSRGRGLVDVAYLAALSVAGKPSRADHRRLLEAYAAADGSVGVTEDLWEEYCLATGAMLVLPAPGILSWDSSGQRSHEMTLAMFRRWAHAVGELGLPDLLGVH